MINRSWDFRYCGCRTEILESFPLKIVSLFFHYPYIRWQQHDGRTRRAETNLRLFYPMFVFPQAVPPHVPGTSQTSQACHATPRRSFWWKACRAALCRPWKGPRKDFCCLRDYKKKRVRRMHQKCISQGYFIYLDLNMGCCKDRPYRQGCLTLVFWLSTDGFAVGFLAADVEKEAFSRGVI